MGEAARRKKLDSSYGKISRLSTNIMKFEEAEKIIEELFKEFKLTISKFMRAQSIPENYQSDSDKIQQWVDKKLLKYHEQDRSILAGAIFSLIVSLASDDLVDEFGNSIKGTPLLLMCFVKIFKNYFNREKSQQFLLKIQQLRELGKPLKTKLEWDSIFEETERELELVLNYPASEENWVFIQHNEQIAIGNLNDCLQMAGLMTKEEYTSTFVEPLLGDNLSNEKKSSLLSTLYIKQPTIRDSLYKNLFNKAVKSGQIYIEVNVCGEIIMSESESDINKNEELGESAIYKHHIFYSPERAEHFREYGF